MGLVAKYEASLGARPMLQVVLLIDPTLSCAWITFVTGWIPNSSIVFKPPPYSIVKFVYWFRTGAA